ATLDLDLGITVDSGGPVIPEQEHVVQALLREVVLTIEAYRAGDPGSDMNHVVVSGDTGVEDELLDGLRRRFDINGERYNPTSCFGWNSVSGAAAGGFAAALGLALGHGGHGNLYVDFLHPKKTVSQHQKSLKKAPIVAAILLLFIGAGVVAYRQVVLPQKEQIVGLDDQIAKARTKLKEYKKFGAMMEQVESFEHEQVVWLDDLADFLLVWPDHDQIVLSEISLSQKERLIEVKMDCKDTKIAADTVDKLDGFKLSEDAPARFDAKLGTTTDQKDKDEYTVRTRMDIKLINRGKSD
ncbi:MAG: hypothetical protein KAV82_00695, partial [Phycisphaerae bacterium]|nr:hypothetical protein [Phycisphaerae bacterium]